jgi:hypothetical protein
VAFRVRRPTRLITHRSSLDRVTEAHDTSGHAAGTQALEVILEA